MAEQPPAWAASDERLRERYRRLMAREHSGHLEDEAWQRLAGDEMRGEERARAFDHVTSCGTCALLFRALELLRTEAAEFDPGAAGRAPASRASRRIPSWMPWLAAACVALALIPAFSQWRGPAARVTRSADAVTAPALIAPSGLLRDAPREFRWRASSGAVSYRVRLFREDGTRLWTSPGVGDNRVAAPDPAEVPLAPGRYFWEVEALRDGRTLARSELGGFTLAR